MPQKVSWTVSVQVLGGPKITASDTMTVDAYDRLDVVVEAGAENKEVEVQPGAAGQVQFVSISSSAYGPELTYRVNSDTANEVALDGQHVLIGSGAVGLLGAAPNTLYFSNDLTEDVSVTVLVARKATD
ncbi:MAG TPA: hypothetical protein VF158_05230 [Longimicrobiales bacterium]